MPKRTLRNLTRRERQIMDIVYKDGKVTVSMVREQMDDPPSYSAVRALLRILEEKGFLKHEEKGPRYVYMPTIPRERAERTALRHLMETFFDGSAERVVAALMDMRSAGLTDEELDRLGELIMRARKEAEGK